MLPASLDWLGWTGLALAVLAFIFMFIKRQLKKPDERTHHIILLNLFPAVHVPVEVSRPEAEKIANKLRDTYVLTWHKLSDIYDTSSVSPAPISLIGTTMNEVFDDHPQVAWLIGAGKVFLRVQDKMYYWFALELHNMFRYLLYGEGNIYETRGQDDIAAANAADKWIRGRFSEEP